MRRPGLAVLAMLATSPVAFDLARAQPARSVAPAPAALRRFEGHLRGTLDARVREAEVSGLLLRVTRVEPRPGAPEVDARSLIGKSLFVALPHGEGTSRPMGVFMVVQQLQPRQEVRVAVQVDPETRLLVAEDVQVLPPPKPAPTAAPRAPGPPADRTAELRRLRREQAELQRRIAELKLLKRELAAQGR